jgi:hypothetical protein
MQKRSLSGHREPSRPLSTQGIGSADLAIHICQGSMLPDSEPLARSALETGSTHMLWIDSDMTFTRDRRLRFLGHSDGIIGINAIQRKPPNRNSAQHEDGTQFTTSDKSTGPEKVGCTGFGVIWVASEVFSKLEKPSFNYRYLPDMDLMRGEDYRFCDLAKEAGYAIHIDHDLSREVGHVGTFPYSPVVKHAAELRACSPS